MEVGQFFTQFFAQIWRILEMNMPFFNIPIWAVWGGILLINVSIKVFRSVLGIGANVGRDTLNYQSNQSGKYPRKGDNQ